jgi:hypothetical protein
MTQPWTGIRLRLLARKRDGPAHEMRKKVNRPRWKLAMKSCVFHCAETSTLEWRPVQLAERGLFKRRFKPHFSRVAANSWQIGKFPVALRAGFAT